MLPLIPTFTPPNRNRPTQGEYHQAEKHQLKPHMYVTILTVWIASLVWFHPRLATLLDLAHSPGQWWALAFFIFFVELAWLYGYYNIFLVVFAKIYQRRKNAQNPFYFRVPGPIPKAAILYTTCNDFVLDSVQSCVEQDYPDFKVYLLDDSSDPFFQAKVESFAERHPSRVEVIRRAHRKGFKAGNLNNALSRIAKEFPYFAIADADEILPSDFLKKLVPILEQDPHCGFVQANHVSNPNQKSKLAQALGVGIDIHWKWHQPLRNRYGFVMFLGHGALIRSKCWEMAGGFPEIVSEDLAFAIRIRELGYRGKFIEDVVCYEDFPDTIRAFRIRHMKWTRGTCEFLLKEAGRLIRSPKISWMEKLDVLFPTLNLPLTFFYFLFMINANVVLPILFGESRVLTMVISNWEIAIPVINLQSGFASIFTLDFYIITLMTFMAPVLCFIVALGHRPLRLWKFLSHSTAVYAALSPLSTLGTLSFLATQKAQFLVTGDVGQKPHERPTVRGISSLNGWIWKFLKDSHPDHLGVQIFEFSSGLFFALICLSLFQISFFGLCLAFMLLPVMHHLNWDSPVVKLLVYLPFIIILTGIGLSTLSALGMQTIFFGYGFHF